MARVSAVVDPRPSIPQADILWWVGSNRFRGFSANSGELAVAVYLGSGVAKTFVVLADVADGFSA